MITLSPHVVFAIYDHVVVAKSQCGEYRPCCCVKLRRGSVPRWSETRKTLGRMQIRETVQDILRVKFRRPSIYEEIRTR
jgi:hypothetical protein